MVVDTTDALGWLESLGVDRTDASRPPVASAVDAAGSSAPDDVPGSGRIDFVVGAALVGVNFFVSTGLVAVVLLQSIGTVYAIFLQVDDPRIGIAPGVPVVVLGALLGLAIGVGGFAFSAWKRWPSYYWPLFGIAVALAAALFSSALSTSALSSGR